MNYWLRELKQLFYELEDRWKRLGVSEQLHSHPKTVAAVTVACLLLFLVVVIVQSKPKTTAALNKPRDVWFYDLNTKELFTAKSSKLPPIETASGTLPDGTPAGVRAYVFIATDSKQPTEPFIGFLEMFTPEGKKAQGSYNPKKHNAKLWAQGRFFRRPEDPEWIPADSPEGMAIYTDYLSQHEQVAPGTKAGQSLID